MKASFRSQPNAPFLLALSLLWFTLIATLIFLQHTLGAFGLNVIPMGEDRVWVQLLETNTGFEAHRQWWQIASRNPLAPWWYWLFSPFISNGSEGLYILRKFIDLFLAISAYLLIDQLLRKENKFLSFSFSALILLWNFSGYIEQIMYIMLIALGFSVLSVYAYLRYIDSGRSQSGWMVTSLLTFFIAVATYSIQCGAIIAIASLMLNQIFSCSAGSVERRTELKKCLTDFLGYAVIFILFLQIWITTSGATSRFFKLDIDLFITNTLNSAKNFLWHDDTTMLLGSVLDHWPWWAIFSSTIIFSIIFILLFSFIKNKNSADEGNFNLHKSGVKLVLIVACALVLPTLALESTSTTWFPGSRSRMVQQIFQPLFYSCLLFFVIALLRRNDRQQKVYVISIAILCSFSAVLGLEYNRKLVEQTRFEDQLAAGIKQHLPAIDRSTGIIALVDGFNWYAGRTSGLTNLFIQMAYASPSIYLETTGTTSTARKSEPIVFDSLEKGVYLPAARKWLPYSNILVVKIDEGGVDLIDGIDSSTFPSTQVAFLSNTPIALDKERLSLLPQCPSRMEFEVTPSERGWSIPEVSGVGDSFVWMASTQATFKLKTSCDGAVAGSFRALSPMAPDILSSLTASVNGSPLALKQMSMDDGSTIVYFETFLNQSKSKGEVVFELQTNRTVVPEGGNRTLAIPFDWITLAQKVQ